MKTHLLTKKRALISSVAMLLVAIIALGTATFAWFTTNTSATADKLSVQTVKASEIVLSDNACDWTDQLHYNYMDKVLKPASSADGVNWFTAQAAAKNKFDASATPTATIPNANIGDYVFMNQLNVCNNGKAAVDSAKINFKLRETNQADGKNYLRLALVAANKKGKDAVLTGDFATSVYAVGEDTANAYTKNESGSIVTKKIDAKDGTNVSLDIGPLGAKNSGTEAKYFNLYIWFEGQDTDCYDLYAGNAMPEITFTVTGDTVAQG